MLAAECAARWARPVNAVLLISGTTAIEAIANG
jgi:hypothetical protein